MPIENSYTFIKSKISSMKDAYPSLRSKTDDYIFSALAVKSTFFKNPALIFSEEYLKEIIVDGVNDGGVDALLLEPNSSESNLILVQSKFYQNIQYEDVINAITKILSFYNNMNVGNYEKINQLVQRKFLTLNAEIGEESKVIFVFYTSANKNGIRNDRIQKAFSALVNNSSKFELQIYFSDDINDAIRESESRRASVENDKLSLDQANNYLEYNEDAVIVNVSAFSVKELYAIHGINLLARNLRYHVRGNDVDSAIKETIKNSPDRFWFKNNGLTIICDTFDINGKEVKLKNFSIVNGGQTTYNLHKSNDLTKDNDFFLPCKIIKVIGNNEDEKNLFSLEIAKATNSQKAIKNVDLKANSPEQVRFSTSMREEGIYYQTKRGELVPKDFRLDYKNSDLSEIGKLGLAAIFQIPATSRNKPKVLYNPEFYEPIFNSDQTKIAKLSREFLYMDSYFRNSFLSKFDNKYQNDPNSEELIPFAHNARTSCVAFATLASRIHQGNLTKDNLKKIFGNLNDGSYSTILYDIFKFLDNYNDVFPKKLFDNKDNYEKVLFVLYEGFIKSGRKAFSLNKKYDVTLTVANYLKKDMNYYLILQQEWDSLEELINKTHQEIDKLIAI
jgi:hypothetical protein